ncbi:lipase [Amycolatopsis mediterranei S699]|uniref:Lipase n=2 Tax=Amycolatopsis mediterranei TaxID=33910 RepID=A0A0H3CYC4_AMYMU|nr:alpha/beta hydrolase [Amycolatopsis mediterranei]ADJ43085.1 lipase [Amycolatopsis mediterranei U32]AEK39782.1 lipase [Amycolatopsis mediterranei S699]AFO74798.1 lipase [Amycolatopsis mediterranei S699]AGT81927.1 lipase [Amycolatopsis mediterranei RB]KDO04995.1 lipase [Amycolatopsis mediterranei]
MRVTNGGAKRILAVLAAALTFGALAPSVAEAAPSSGWNDWGCRPSAAHPEPVVLVHGLGANDTVNWFFHAPKIAAQGYCVFSLTYGTGVLGPGVGGLASMRDSAAQLGRFVDRVRSTTGAAKVDIVGHSEGSTMPAYYLKYGGAAKVARFVGFGANYRGTTLGGLDALAKALLTSVPELGAVLRTACGACTEYLAPSAFLDDLARGGVHVPGPTYTSIVSKYDEVVTPYTSGILGEPGTTDIVLQDFCAGDASGHLSQAADPNVTGLILHALDAGYAPTCTPFTLPL